MFGDWTHWYTLINSDWAAGYSLRDRDTVRVLVGQHNLWRRLSCRFRWVLKCELSSWRFAAMLNRNAVLFIGLQCLNAPEVSKYSGLHLWYHWYPTHMSSHHVISYIQDYLCNSQLIQARVGSQLRFGSRFANSFLVTVGNPVDHWHFFVSSTSDRCSHLEMSFCIN